jgi:hypothetical protein
VLRKRQWLLHVADTREGVRAWRKAGGRWETEKGVAREDDYAHKYTNIYIYTSYFSWLCIYIYTYKYICIHTHTHAHVYICICIYIYIYNIHISYIKYIHTSSLIASHELEFRSSKLLVTYVWSRSSALNLGKKKNLYSQCYGIFPV